MANHYDVIIFDGNNTAHKAYHVNKYLSAKIDGENVHTGMMYGFLNMLMRVYLDFSVQNFVNGKCVRNSRVYVVWDSIDSADGNRELNEHYKENRKPQSEQELLDKINFEKLMANTKGILSTLNIMQFQKSKVEADDIIATIATKISNKGKSVLIVTEDKDYRQLISDRINLYGLTQKFIWDVETFTSKTGLVKPSHFVDYLAICGDAIDDFGGVQGFGPQKAMQLLTHELFCDQDNISEYIISDTSVLDDFDSWSETTKQKFIDDIDSLEQCYKLAKLNTDINSAELIVKRHYNSIDVFKALCESYMMRSFKKNMSVFEEIFNSTQYWKRHKDVL